MITVYLYILTAAVISTNARSAECIFKSTASALNSASDFAVSASVPTEDGSPSLVKFAPSSVQFIPKQLIDGRPAQFYDTLFSRRHNTQSYMWASSQNEERIGAALAHLIYCTAEKFSREDDANRHSLCISSVSGDQTQQSLDARCDTNLRSILLIGDNNDIHRSNRTGTQACWCEPACMTLNASFIDTSSESSQKREITSFVVLEETNDSPVMEASEYERNKTGNSAPVTTRYEENLVDAQPPADKGIFSSFNTEGTGGSVQKSLRIINVVDQIPAEDQCSAVKGALSDVERSAMARVEEEVSSVLNIGISNALQQEPAKLSELFLTIASSLTAVFAFSFIGTASRLIEKTKISVHGKRRVLAVWSGVAGLVLFEMAIENLPIYFLLQQEVEARNHVEHIAFEVTSAGNQQAILPIASQSSEEFLEVISALVLITVRNRNTNVVGIANAAAALTFLSIWSTVASLRQLQK